jgi:hypothetical protein
MKLMKLKFQGPPLVQAPSKRPGGGGAYTMFTWSYVFIKSAKGRYFNLNHLSIIKVCQSINKNITVLNFFMFLVFVSIFKFVTWCDFFSHSK